ncbi:MULTISPECIES: hypothetical protein [unclassified Rathayibacter]|uniref:hypothetical protein n=1 Tax=unclassified Rathayibacter TaxID=2609250 RepID=UPI0006F529EC|nr:MULTISPECIES: hypothetical protein [unclassified Rathayibacter]KQQ05285.1 hypothetical protein ASF42_01345 [Rathayibacter sp. Leaf294]KQS13147.1 hypothetical protein ASG06_01345 [Rathayibacter sp. Leaf185]
MTGLTARMPSASAAVAALVRPVAGVAMLVPARAEVRDVIAHAATVLAPSSAPLASGPLGTATGGTFAEPVLIRISGDEVAVAVDVCVAAEASAPDVARAVGAVVREWCLAEHPQRRARITVRIAAVD